MGRIWAAFIVALFISIPIASETLIRIGIATTHIPYDDFSSDDWNNHNELFGISIDNIEFGTMVNSYYTRSYYLAYKTPHLPFILGVVSGYSFNCISYNFTYKCNTKDLFPLIALYYDVTDVLSIVVVGNAISAVVSF